MKIALCCHCNGYNSFGLIAFIACMAVLGTIIYVVIKEIGNDFGR